MSNEPTEKQLNEEQLKSVYFDDSDVVVVAGAGSGKTMVLASRIIRLLIYKKVAIDRILCLTFTKKATAEMYARIHFLLRQSIHTKTFNGEPLSDEIINFLKEQEENFHTAQVSTLDSFSLRTAQIGLSRMGIITEPMVEDSLKHYIKIFVEIWLLEHPKSEIKDLLKIFRFDELVSGVLTPLLGACSCIENHLEQDHNVIVESLEKQIHLSFQEIKGLSSALINTINESKNDMKITPSLDAFFDVAENLYNILVDFKPFNILEFEDFSLRFSIKDNKELDHTLKDIARAIRNTKDAHNNFIFTYQNKDYYKKYYIAFQAIVDDWVQYQRNTLGIFSHTNIAEIARYTLATYPDIKRWYATQYQYIIIDEFQDNNMDQKELLYNIADTDAHNHYFFVGDPKQSIYKFRGADIRAFLSLTEDSHNTILHMKNNYRSTPQLITLFNNWFGTLFADKRINDLIPYEAQNIPDKNTDIQEVISKILNKEELANFPKEKIPNISCLVEMINTFSDEAELVNDKLTLEAYAISKRIATMIDNGIPLQDIAILSRSKSIFSYIAQHLKKQNIPYIMEDSVVALRQDIGIDFHAWLSLLVYPEDRSAYATLLRSPLLHISDELVIALLSYQVLNEEKEDIQVPFYMPPQRAKDNPTLVNTIYQHPQDLQKILLLKEKYEHIRTELQNNISLLDIFQHFWIECGYRYILLRNKRYQVFLSQYETIKTMIINNQENGLVAFIDLLESIFAGESLEVKALSTDEVSAVKIMSIHKSKGLEFPYVILANMGGALSSTGGGGYGYFAQKEHVNYIDLKTQDSPHYLLTNSENKQESFESFYKSIIKEANKNTYDEQLRLLYVGMTRAEKGLILSGVYKQKKQVSTNSFFDWLINYDCIYAVSPEQAPQIQGRFYSDHKHAFQIFHNLTNLDEELTQDFSVPDKPNPINKIIEKELAIQPFELHNKQLEVTPSSNSETNKKVAQGETLPNLSVDVILNQHNMYTAFGTYCHYLLNYYCKQEIPEKTPVKLEAQLLPISDKDTKIFLDSAEKLCQKFLQSDIWQEAIHQEQTLIYTEHPFLMWNEKHGVFVRGIIDLLIITPTHIQIVDYKVDKTKNPERYKYQMSAYIHAVKKMLNNPKQDIQCHLYYLRDGSTCLQPAIISEDEMIAFLLKGDTPVEDNQLLVDDDD